MRKVIDTIWFTEGFGAKKMFPCFGVVIVEEENNYRKAYIGRALGVDEKQDIELIKDWGSKLDIGTLELILKALKEGDDCE